jgi:hypothetical protein
VVQSVVEDLDRLSDDEMLSELLEAGLDPTEVAARTRSVLLEAERAFRRSRLAKVRESLAAAGEKLATAGRAWMPSSPGARRELLDAILGRHPGLQPALTVQFRDFRELTDEDVESILLQIHELGVDTNEP